MKKIALLLFYFCFVIKSTIAQSDAPSPYKFSSDIFTRSNKDSDYFKGLSPTDLSFVGLYKEALIQYDKPRNEIKKIAAIDSADFLKKYFPVEARKFIIQKAKENQILIFNEAHHNPRNRVFVTSLLKDLRNSGYKYFAAETFANDSFFIKEKHPVFFTGFYTTEPQFGNLVREAIKLNFTLYPYEAIPITNGKEREIGEAKNLQSLLTKDPNAKIIIYCGFSHIREDSVPSWGKAMAGRLKEFTGIDPYTIDQITLSERSNKEAENLYFKLIYSDTYSVLTDRNRTPFKSPGVDALLYSPPTMYIYNRPNWVFENNKLPYLLNAKDINLSFPIIAKAYLDTDNLEKTIPIDVIEIKSRDDVSETAIALFDKGHFIITLVDKIGKTQTFRVVK